MASSGEWYRSFEGVKRLEWGSLVGDEPTGYSPAGLTREFQEFSPMAQNQFNQVIMFTLKTYPTSPP